MINITVGGAAQHAIVVDNNDSVSLGFRGGVEGGVEGKMGMGADEVGGFNMCDGC